jgi:sec-independent protein translocase protein TatA
LIGAGLHDCCGAALRAPRITFVANQGAYMFEGLFQPMHLLVIFGLALLVFGPKKLPELGKGLGESIRGFKSAMKTEENQQTSIAASSATDNASKE